MSPTLGIVQDYVPLYRVEFFDRLADRLQQNGINCVVIAGSAPAGILSRGDAVSSAPWLRNVADPWEFWPRESWPRFFGYGNDRQWSDCDALVMGLRGASIDLSAELLRKRRTRRRIGVWGHLSRTTKPPNRLDIAVERWQMKSSDHVFAYTEQGRKSAIACGVKPSKVTAVMNTLEVHELLAAYKSLKESDVHCFISKNSLVEGKIFSFVGGIDSSKRIEFLADVLELLWSSDCEIKLLVAGRGEQKSLLNTAIRRGQVVMLDYAGPHAKALAMKSSQALINPGRVGLLAVESLAIGIPLITTNWTFHAPEYEYLVHGRDVYRSENTPKAFTSLILDHVDNYRVIPEHIGRPYPRLEDMVARFALGVEAMLAGNPN